MILHWDNTEVGIFILVEIRLVIDVLSLADVDIGDGAIPLIHSVADSYLTLWSHTSLLLPLIVLNRCLRA